MKFSTVAGIVESVAYAAVALGGMSLLPFANDGAPDADRILMPATYAANIKAHICLAQTFGVDEGNVLVVRDAPVTLPNGPTVTGAHALVELSARNAEFSLSAVVVENDATAGGNGLVLHFDAAQRVGADVRTLGIESVNGTALAFAHVYPNAPVANSLWASVGASKPAQAVEVPLRPQDAALMTAATNCLLQNG